jgi:hypothetical protein
MPLIDKALYARLSALRPKLEAANVSNVAHVFVPVGVALPPSPSRAARLLFIGRATRYQ